MRSNFRANERRGSSLTIPNAAESQEHLIPRLKEEFLKDRLRLEIRTKIRRRIRNNRKIATWLLGMRVSAYGTASLGLLGAHVSAYGTAL